MNAVLTPCGRYRYLLQRRWGDGPEMAVIMLNPSTADAEQDDPTIRRLYGFASAHGYSAISVANCYAWRAAKPADMWAAPREEIVGPENDMWLGVVATLPLRMVAWGNGPWSVRADEVLSILRADGRPVFCLGKTAMGNPLHPLYVPAAARLVEFA